jgi:glycosyltransferase involved in cell wall biosynthesis
VEFSTRQSGLVSSAPTLAESGIAPKERDEARAPRHNQRKLRVLRAITRLNVGGPSIHAVVLTRMLDPERFESALVTGVESATEGNMRYFAEEQGVHPLVVEELGREVNPLNDLRSLGRMVQLIRARKPDIVHTHMAKAGTTARLAARLAGVPIVIHTYHGHVFHSYFSPRKTAVYLAIERFLALMTDRIIVVGDRQRDEIAGFRVAPISKIVPIPLGLPLESLLTVEETEGQLRSELGLGRDTPLVGIIARLVPIKAHEFFLQAAAKVGAERPDAHFVIVGDGERRDELESLSRELQLSDRVHFLGWRREMRSIYADLDVVVLSSLNEGSPVAVIEALAAGRAVVSTAVGGVPEVVHDTRTGLLVPPRDADGLAQGILRFLSDPEWAREVGRLGRASVYPRYSIGRLVTDIEQLYLELAHEKGLVA